MDLETHSPVHGGRIKDEGLRTSGTLANRTPEPPVHMAIRHPQLTVYRALVVFSTFGFSTAKAILTYRGKTIASITVEWIFAVVIFLM